jgi:hypothetical protein
MPPEPPKPTEEELLDILRNEWDRRIYQLQDRIGRYNNQLAGGFVTTDTPETIQRIYQVMQELRDLPAIAPILSNLRLGLMNHYEWFKLVSVEYDFLFGVIFQSYSCL